MVDPAFGAAGFARLAPEVNRLAAGGDRPAAAILERNAEALVAMVAAVAAALLLREPPVAALGEGWSIWRPCASASSRDWGGWEPS